MPYDVAAQLRTPDERVAYRDAWLDAPDDAAGIARALGDVARATGMTQVAKNAGVSTHRGSRNRAGCEARLDCQPTQVTSGLTGFPLP